MRGGGDCMKNAANSVYSQHLRKPISGHHSPKSLLFNVGKPISGLDTPDSRPATSGLKAATTRLKGRQPPNSKAATSELKAGNLRIQGSNLRIQGRSLQTQGRNLRTQGRNFLLPEQLGELAEAAAPGKPLVGSAW